MKEVSMDKEKEIEELAETIIEQHCFQHGCDHCGWYESRKGCEDKLIYADLARYLIEVAGYRKADEVKKEIVGSILTDIRSEMTVAMFSFKPELKMDLMTILLRLERDYGVEVDE